MMIVVLLGSAVIAQSMEAPSAASASPTAVVKGGYAPEGPKAVRAEPTASPGPAGMPPPGEDAQSPIIVSARRPATPGDPYEAVNARSFAITQSIDKAMIGPAAMTYKRSIPLPVRDGLRNFFRNLNEPVVFLNFLLQMKPGKAAETFGRFTINSTAGAAGLFDVAKRCPINLPRRPNGFADTMGYYGVKPGAFLFLPLIGPTTTRDLVGGTLDRLVLPLSVGWPFNQLAYSAPAGVIMGLDHRVQFDGQLEAFRTSSADPYLARRDFYLRQRAAEIEGLHSRHQGEEAKPDMPCQGRAFRSNPPSISETVPVSWSSRGFARHTNWRKRWVASPS